MTQNDRVYLLSFNLCRLSHLEISARSSNFTLLFTSNATADVAVYAVKIRLYYHISINKNEQRHDKVRQSFLTYRLKIANPIVTTFSDFDGDSDSRATEPPVKLVVT